MKQSVDYLEKIENQAVFCTLAMMSYNPSIGRVLEKGGVNEFINIATEQFSTINNIQTRQDFDSWHEQFAVKVQDQIKTALGNVSSYGQAQKPINVFLKVYVDWARLPRIETAEKLRPYLHVPLDSVMMKFTKRNFLDYYQKHNLRLTNLAKIDTDLYNRWQKCFREISPKKPLLMDVFWAKKRFEKAGRFSVIVPK
jgi:hypothetical protein